MIEIPARKGKAARLGRGTAVRIVNTTGQQVVDFWAFNAADLREFMSMEHSRVALGHIIPGKGDTLVTNHRRPILSLVEDTSGGIHDTLFAACDRRRYELLGYVGYHDNCTDNLAAGLAERGLTPPEVPAPLNLFMNIPVIDGNRVEVRPRSARPAAGSSCAPRSTASSPSPLARKTCCRLTGSRCSRPMPISRSSRKSAQRDYNSSARASATA